ncbi:VC0807 family protein [Granulosicoccus antarcticus]|uniref:MFS transporter n=1 Tax=Granulosicoccus antarcticus IMCC3135 TaxID=1192854 RepID=A0A2Z2NHF8_9GAMM|nr:VC0807 family protein [Granulosicoccus antarcticus]ASJ70473.1 hypothetical protein IMCC3135_01770 [Granulosicoccus antarcticus IMCC3135]
MTQTDTNKKTPAKQSPFVDLIVSIVLPSIILMKFSGDDKLGATNALILALAFPIGYGLYDWFINGKRNMMAVLGVVSVMLTGGIGLLKLDAQWLAIKEAAIPLCIGIGVLVANKLGYPLIRKLLFNPTIMNVEKIDGELDKMNTRAQFETRLDHANTLLAGTFLFSAVMNYFLAKFIVTSESGSSAFNEELGRMTLLSYPVIAIPSMIMMLAIFWFIWRTVNRLTGLTLEEIMVTDGAATDTDKPEK